MSRGDFMNNFSKDEILNLAKEKGVKLSYLNTLIKGYRGKLTDWKNGKTTLTEDELKIIVNYLTNNKTPATDEELKFALFNGTDGITDEMFEEVKQYAAMVKLREQQKGKK